MSFRTRLITFFVVIVIVPMIAIGVLVFRLIAQSEQGKADARANGLATAAASVYTSAGASARADAARIAQAAGDLHGRALRVRVSAIATQAGLTRVTVSQGSRPVLDFGDPDGIAPGRARVAAAGRPITLITVSELSAAAYARELTAPGAAIIVRSGNRTLASTAPGHLPASLRPRSTLSLGGTDYRAVTQRFHGFSGPVDVTVLSQVTATSSSLTASQALAAAFIAGFLLLAFMFAMLASRQLHGQVSRFLIAARRLGGGDFSEPVPIEGRDEFASLGEEFNRMSVQLEHRIEDLGRERARLRESIRRIGDAFASNLDRPALEQLALRAACDAVQAGCGRLSSRAAIDDPLGEAVRLGSLAGLGDLVIAAERAALKQGGVGEAGSQDAHVASVALGTFDGSTRSRGLITVARRGEPFTDDDRDVLRSLAVQAGAALENVELHFQVRRQAVTDELTGLVNHRRFQELLTLETEQVRRYHHPLGLIMLDIDNFKSINDTYGHPQGDVVLKQVARVVRDSSREVDVPARYGGEEMALILPHTDLEGAYAIAERVRGAVEALRVPRLDGEGVLRVTASVGVTSSTDGEKDALIAEADAALYVAKRGGKNRTVRGQRQTANVFGAE